MTSFTWQDGERLIRFGRGSLDDAPAILGDGYTLVTTERAAAEASGVVAAAGRVLNVGPGRVDELAAELLDHLEAAPLVVALGGGRVVDVAKALAAARPPRQVAAIPTTLSAAEMTRGHRRAKGTPQDAPGVRPAIVINDPALSASQPVGPLAASAANALAHALEGPLTPRTSPVPELVAGESARLLAGAWGFDSASAGPPAPRGARDHGAAAGVEPDRDALALGALLSGYVIDATGYGLHHVASQTLVRYAGIGHGPANAAMLPHTLGALRRRAAERLDALARALGADPAAVAADLARRAGATHLRELGVTESQLDECARAAARRPDLAGTPPAADEAELRALYAAAF